MLNAPPRTVMELRSSEGQSFQGARNVASRVLLQGIIVDLGSVLAARCSDSTANDSNSDKFWDESILGSCAGGSGNTKANSTAFFALLQQAQSCLIPAQRFCLASQSCKQALDALETAEKEGKVHLAPHPESRTETCNIPISMMFGYKETWVAMCFNERLDYQTEPGATITKMLLHYLTLLPVALAGGYKTPTAITINGTYRGRHLPEFSQDLFLGIPFARAPLLGNPLPWDESWKGSRSAEYNGAICHCYASPAEMERANVTEKAGECLNLNIIRPSGIDKKKLPVVVWLYGGGFVDGFGADINSNLSYIVQESVAQHMPIIAVTLNYRVGFLGFPGGAPVAEEGVTNLGFKDQRKALHWVQENIAGFGGDPDKVTLWGQSAGSHSITHQILAYGDQRGEKRLFRGAIMASSSVGVGNSHHAKRADALAGYRRILQATNCASAHDSLACLRGLSAGQLWEASLTTADLSAWGPMVDGDFVSMPPTIQLLSGKFRRDVSVLIGTNSDEGIRVANTIPEDLDTDQQVFSILKQLFLNARNETLDLIMRAYPADIPGPPYGLSMSDTDRLCEGFRAVGGLRCGTQFRRFAAMFGDFFVIAGQRAFAQAFAKFGLTAYSYRFDTWPTSFPITNFTNFKPGFASHSTEYSYFFRFPREHNLYGNNPPIPEGSRAHLQLSHGIAAKLIGYIYTGDPNAISVPGFPTWPKYDVRKPTNLVLNATEHPDRLNVHVEPDTWRKEGMAVWPSNPFELDYRRPVPEGYGSQ